MSDADLKLAGITAGTVRLSIGLEDPRTDRPTWIALSRPR